MSDSYSQWKMTARFAAATQQAAATGDKVEWVHVIASDDTFTHEELDKLDDTVLKTIKQKQVTTISRVAITGSTVTITAVFTNKQNAADYQINTLLLVARYNNQEFLAGVSIANSKDTAFRMPSESPTEITEFTTRPQITLTTTGAISTSVDPVASATNERVDDVVKDLEEQITAINKDKQSLWERLSNFVNKTESATISGVMTFASTIIGNISGNSGTTNKLKTPRKINGVDFDGSKPIEVKASNDDDLVHKSGNENVSGRKVFKDRSKHYGGMSLSISDVNGNNAKNLSALSIDTPSATKVGEIDFYGQTFYTNPAIENQVNDNYTLGLQSGGTVVVGSGEAATGIMTSMQEKNMPSSISSNGQAEQLILVADNTLYIGSGYQEGGSSGKWIVLRDDGNTLFPGNVSAARFIGNADTATRLAKPRKINGVEDDGTKDITIPTDSDSGWKTLTLSKDFAPWGDNPALTPIYKIRNGVVTIKGVVHPTRGFKPNEEGTIAQLPKELLSNSKIEFSSVQQASSADKWNLVVRVNGGLSLRGYGDGNSFKPMAVDTWLPFSVTYVL